MGRKGWGNSTKPQRLRARSIAAAKGEQARLKTKVEAALAKQEWVAVAKGTFSGSDEEGPSPAPCKLLQRHCASCNTLFKDAKLLAQHACSSATAQQSNVDVELKGSVIEPTPVATKGTILASLANLANLASPATSSRHTVRSCSEQSNTQ